MSANPSELINSASRSTVPGEYTVRQTSSNELIISTRPATTTTETTAAIARAIEPATSHLPSKEELAKKFTTGSPPPTRLKDGWSISRVDAGLLQYNLRMADADGFLLELEGLRNNTPTRVHYSNNNDWLFENQMSQSVQDRVKHDHAKLETFVAFLNANTSVKFLCITRTWMKSNHLEALAPTFARLTKIRFNYNEIDGESGVPLAKIIPSDSPVATIVLRRNNITNGGAMAWAKRLSMTGCLTRLTYINFRDNYIGEKGGEALADALAYNSTLTHVNLRGNGIGEKGAAAWARTLKGNPRTLTKLNLSWNKIAEQGAKELGEAIAVNSTLVHLNVAGNFGWNEDDFNSGMFRNALTGYQINLRHTNYNEVRQDRDIGTSFVNGLIINKSLTHLDMGSCGTSDRMMVGLAEVISKNSQLKFIDASGNYVYSGKTMEKVAKALGVNTTLTSLDLSTEHRGFEVEPHLSLAFERNFSLITCRIGFKSIAPAFEINKLLQRILNDAKQFVSKTKAMQKKSVEVASGIDAALTTGTATVAVAKEMTAAEEDKKLKVEIETDKVRCDRLHKLLHTLDEQLVQAALSASEAHNKAVFRKINHVRTLIALQFFSLQDLQYVEVDPVTQKEVVISLTAQKKIAWLEPLCQLDVGSAGDETKKKALALLSTLYYQTGDYPSAITCGRHGISEENSEFLRNQSSICLQRYLGNEAADSFDEEFDVTYSKAFVAYRQKIDSLKQAYENNCKKFNLSPLPSLIFSNTINSAHLGTSLMEINPLLQKILKGAEQFVFKFTQNTANVKDSKELEEFKTKADTADEARFGGMCALFYSLTDQLTEIELACKTKNVIKEINRIRAIIGLQFFSMQEILHEKIKSDKQKKDVFAITPQEKIKFLEPLCKLLPDGKLKQRVFALLSTAYYHMGAYATAITYGRHAEDESIEKQMNICLQKYLGQSVVNSFGRSIVGADFDSTYCEAFVRCKPKIDLLEREYEVICKRFNLTPFPSLTLRVWEKAVQDLSTTYYAMLGINYIEESRLSTKTEPEQMREAVYDNLYLVLNPLPTITLATLASSEIWAKNMPQNSKLNNAFIKFMAHLRHNFLYAAVYHLNFNLAYRGTFIEPGFASEKRVVNRPELSTDYLRMSKPLSRQSEYYLPSGLKQKLAIILEEVRHAISDAKKIVENLISADSPARNFISSSDLAFSLLEAIQKRLNGRNSVVEKLITDELEAVQIEVKSMLEVKAAHAIMMAHTLQSVMAANSAFDVVEALEILEETHDLRPPLSADYLEHIKTFFTKFYWGLYLVKWEAIFAKAWASSKKASIKKDLSPSITKEGEILSISSSPQGPGNYLGFSKDDAENVSISHLPQPSGGEELLLSLNSQISAVVAVQPQVEIQAWTTQSIMSKLSELIATIKSSNSAAETTAGNIKSATDFYQSLVIALGKTLSSLDEVLQNLGKKTTVYKKLMGAHQKIKGVVEVNKTGGLTAEKTVKQFANVVDAALSAGNKAEKRLTPILDSLKHMTQPNPMSSSSGLITFTAAGTAAANASAMPPTAASGTSAGGISNSSLSNANALEPESKCAVKVNSRKT